MNSPWPTPISVVRKMTEKAGCISSPRGHILDGSLADRRLRQEAVDLQRIVRAIELFGIDSKLRLAARQVVVRGMGSPLRHELVAAVLADRFRHDRFWIVNVAEKSRVRRTGEHA